MPETTSLKARHILNNETDDEDTKKLHLNTQARLDNYFWRLWPADIDFLPTWCVNSLDI